MTALTLISGVVTNLQFKGSNTDGGQMTKQGPVNFTCTVNGVQLSGYMGYTGVSETTLKNSKNDVSYDIFYKGEPGIEEGDTVEFVVRQAEGYMYIEAARSPKHRLIWMPLGMTGGGCTRKYHHATWKTSTLGPYAVCTPLFFLIYRYALLPSDKILFSIVLFLVLGSVEAFLYWRYYHDAKEATGVMRAFGYENPKHVDLAAISNEKCQQHREKTGLNIYFDGRTFRY